MTNTEAIQRLQRFLRDLDVAVDEWQATALEQAVKEGIEALKACDRAARVTCVACAEGNHQQCLGGSCVCVHPIERCGELSGGYGTGFYCWLMKGHGGDHSPVAPDPAYFVSMLTQMAGYLEEEAGDLANQNRPLDKYQVGAWAQRRENLKRAALCIETMAARVKELEDRLREINEHAQEARDRE